jgi:hypothetical protein
MSITKYKSSFSSIEPVEIEKESEKSVWLYGFRIGGGKGPLRRADKRTSWECYHNTWEEAKAFLISLAVEEVASARSQLEEAEEKLAHCNSLEQPASALLPQRGKQ